MAVNPELSPKPLSALPRFVAAGALIAAFAASSCCILPVALFSLGIGGVWIANFTQLAPYKPIFVAITFGFVGAGYWLVYRASKRRCAEGDSCARPLPNKVVKVVLLLATVVVVAAIGFDYVAPYLLS